LGHAIQKKDAEEVSIFAGLGDKTKEGSLAIRKPEEEARKEGPIGLTNLS